ncbi:MAG: creatininase family protein [Caldilineaceae bacterium]
MSSQPIILGKLTRREFRAALAAGKYQAAIIPTGSIEQHLEHLAMEYDIRAATYLAEQVAQQLYPQVIVATPMQIGISEHHMIHKGSLTAKPGSWSSVLFDAVESLTRHGIKNIFILNGHGGNEAPMYGMIRQWQLYFQSVDPNINVQFHSYWNLSRAEAEQHCKGRVPGHAQEYETAMALAICPENVRHDAMQEQEDKQPLDATAEQGQILVDAAIRAVKQFIAEMLQGEHREIQDHLWSAQLDPKVGRK